MKIHRHGGARISGRSISARRLLRYRLGGLLGRGFVAAALIVVALSALAGWLGYGALRAHMNSSTEARYVHTATAGALGLATIDASHVKDDVQRILDSSTGEFHDEFSSRSAGFVDFVTKAHSTSQATIRAAGLESMAANEARVAVAMAVKVAGPGEPADGQPSRAWRLRITVRQMADGSMKISQVEFVP